MNIIFIHQCCSRNNSRNNFLFFFFLVFFLSFLFFFLHFFTWLAIGIHFLPHTICLVAFLPLERLRLPGWRTRRVAADEQALVA